MVIHPKVKKRRTWKSISKSWVLNRLPPRLSSSPLWRTLWFSFCFPSTLLRSNKSDVSVLLCTNAAGGQGASSACVQNVPVGKGACSHPHFTVVIVAIVPCLTEHLITKGFSYCLHESLLFCVLLNRSFYPVTDSCSCLWWIYIGIYEICWLKSNHL